MKKTFSKILQGDQARHKLAELAQEGKKITLCYGHFNVIHPGHIRFLQHATELGEVLVAGVWGDEELKVRENRGFFSQKERSEALSTIAGVDWVVILGEVSLEECIQSLKPHSLILGKEFREDRLDEVKDHIELVQQNGGEVVFSSGEVHYTGSDRLFHSAEEIHHQSLEAFKGACERQKIKVPQLKAHLQNFTRPRLLVLGDTIVDQYIACDALGMSAEAPVLAIRELESKEFIGGAAIVACHVRSLGASCHFLSVIGEDDSGKYVVDEMARNGINAHLFKDSTRPTTYKIRYMVGNQKLLRVSRLQDHSISKDLEAQVINCIQELAPQLDGIIVSDFVYGVITPRVLTALVEIAKRHQIKLYGDLQCSSQIGNVCKFKEFDLITPTEREARIALSDQESGLEKISRLLFEATGVKNLMITLGPEGFVAFEESKGGGRNSQHFPALATNAIDVAGAGDTLLATTAVAHCAGMELIPSSALGSCAAAIVVGRVGNIPITTKELDKYLDQLMHQMGRG